MNDLKTDIKDLFTQKRNILVVSTLVTVLVAVLVVGGFVLVSRFFVNRSQSGVDMSSGDSDVAGFGRMDTGSNQYLVYNLFSSKVEDLKLEPDNRAKIYENIFLVNYKHSWLSDFSFDAIRKSKLQDKSSNFVDISAWFSVGPKYGVCSQYKEYLSFGPMLSGFDLDESLYRDGILINYSAFAKEPYLVEKIRKTDKNGNVLLHYEGNRYLSGGTKSSYSEDTYYFGGEYAVKHSVREENYDPVTQYHLFESLRFFFDKYRDSDLSKFFEKKYFTGDDGNENEILASIVYQLFGDELSYAELVGRKVVDGKGYYLVKGYLNSYCDNPSWPRSLHNTYDSRLVARDDGSDVSALKFGRKVYYNYYFDETNFELVSKLLYLDNDSDYENLIHSILYKDSRKELLDYRDAYDKHFKLDGVKILDHKADNKYYSSSGKESIVKSLGDFSFIYVGKSPDKVSAGINPLYLEYKAKYGYLFDRKFYLDGPLGDRYYDYMLSIPVLRTVSEYTSQKYRYPIDFGFSLYKLPSDEVLRIRYKPLIEQGYFVKSDVYLNVSYNPTKAIKLVKKVFAKEYDRVYEEPVYIIPFGDYTYEVAVLPQPYVDINQSISQLKDSGNLENHDLSIAKRNSGEFNVLYQRLLKDNNGVN